MTFGNRFFFGENIYKFNIFYPFLKRTLKTYKSFDSLFHVLFLTKEVKSSGVYWLQKTGGHIWWIGQDINWKKPPIHTMHNILWYFLCYFKRISTTIIDFYEHQHCKVQTKADRLYHGCCRLAGRFFLNREWEKSVTIMVLQYARIILWP